jgi:hypothetical protein
MKRVDSTVTRSCKTSGWVEEGAGADTGEPRGRLPRQGVMSQPNRRALLTQHYGAQRGARVARRVVWDVGCECVGWCRTAMDGWVRGPWVGTQEVGASGSCHPPLPAGAG